MPHRRLAVYGWSHADPPPQPTNQPTQVLSYGFSSPFFAGPELSHLLSKHGLAANLNTIWRAGDASPHFFTLCGELFIAATPGGEAPANGADSGGGGGEVSPLMARMGAVAHAQSPQLEAVQAWCRHVAENVGVLPRAKAAGRLMAQPLQVRAKAVGGGGVCWLPAGHAPVAIGAGLASRWLVWLSITITTTELLDRCMHAGV